MGIQSVKHKRNPLSEAIRYKASMCVYGGQTQEGIHHVNIIAPVVTWTTIQFMLILSLVHVWHTHQIDFTLAYPQAKVSHNSHMLGPEKFQVQNNQPQMDQTAQPRWKQMFKIKLAQNLYRMKDAGTAWFNHLIWSGQTDQQVIGPPAPLWLQPCSLIPFTLMMIWFEWALLHYSFPPFPTLCLCLWWSLIIKGQVEGQAKRP